MAAILSLSCLGPPQVAVASGDPVRFRTRKHLALLVRLAVEPGRKFTRDYLTDLLWSDAPARLANHSLAQALSVIREKLGRAHVLVQRATVALGDGAVDVDVHRLDGPDVDIRGAFLEGFDLPAARPFEDWKDEWRAKLLPRIRDALVRQMDAGRRVGDFAAVERHAGVLYELDPLSEDAVRGTIEARAWAGDRSSALKAYAAYEARLAQELDAKPSADLQRMADLLREGRRGPTARPRAVGEPLARAERRFEAETVIGREREFSVLYDAWLAARRRAPAIVVLTGDPGLGKTTLANAFVSTCQLEGGVVTRAQAYDAERDLPFAVLAELVRQLALQRAIAGAEPEALSELSRLTPEIVAQYPGVPKPVEWAAEIVPLRLADAFLKTVTAAAEESPVVLVVDDIHAADNASTAILHMVARKLAPTRLLVILAARSAELRASGAPCALTSDPSLEAVCRLDLEPLPDEPANRLVERVRLATGTADTDLPLERILRAGRGNPLALELLTREWVTHGPESLLRDLEAVNTQPAAAIGIPRAIKAVFERQVARLDVKTRAVLDLAAVLGRRLADLTLYEAADCSPVEAGEALARLRDEGFLREVRGDIEFRNELIRAQAYYAIPVPARQHLHRRVGELLAVQTSGESGSSPLEVAWHFLRGGSHTSALPFAVQGAQVSLDIGAPYEAERLLKALVVPGTGGPSQRQLHLLLARAFLDQSKGTAAAPVLEALMRDRTGLGKKEAAELSRMDAQTEYLINRDSDQRYSSAARQAIEDAANAGDPELLARALFEFARSAVSSGDIMRLREAADRTTLALQRPALQTHPMLFYTKAYCDFFSRDVASATHSLEEALRLLAVKPNRTDAALVYAGYGVCKRTAGASEEGVAATLKALDLTISVGDDSRACILAGNLAAVEQERGNLTTAIEWGLKSLDYAHKTTNPPYLVSSYMSLAETYVLLGRSTDASRCCDLAKDLMETRQAHSERILYWLEGAGIALALGNTPMALSLIQSAEEYGERGEHLMADPGVYYKFVAFRAAHTQGLEAARAIIDRAEGQLRGRHFLALLSIVAARAWLEKRTLGFWTADTGKDLGAFEEYGLPGKRALLSLQGFI